MPRIGAVAEERSCLICGAKTTGARLGMDVCRACTVFYRRSKNRVFTCRTNSNECPIGPEGVNCRKCRLDRIRRLLTESGAPDLGNCSDLYEFLHGEKPLCSCECRGDLCLSPPSQRPIIERLRANYKTMCDIRYISELSLRPNPPHPMQMMKNRDNLLYPATVTSIDATNRVFLSAVMPFAYGCFPEFNRFGDEEQWKIIMNFQFRFSTFECTYRADKIFPDEMDKTLGGFTTYMSAENAANFFSDCPNANLKLEEAKRLMQQRSKTEWMKNRKLMARLKPDFDEFLAIVGIMFWRIEGQDVGERAIDLSKRYRSDILQELHVYYRDELGMEDYAARLGELLTILEFYEKPFNEFFELLRLLNVFSDDSFSYRMVKDMNKSYE